MRPFFETERAREMYKIYSDMIDETNCFLKFLNIARFVLERNDERYLEEIKKIKPKHLESFEKMFSLLIADEKDGRDILGDFYQGTITMGECGQFFTPTHVVNLICEAVYSSLEDKKRVNVFDPCCGSGRFLLTYAKKYPYNTAYGIDVDERCSIMSAINLALHGINGFIFWGNTLTNEIWRVYRIGIDYSKGSLLEETEDVEVLKRWEDFFKIKEGSIKYKKDKRDQLMLF